MSDQVLPPVESLSFENALLELETIVRQLEEGRIPLEQAVQVYTRGAALKTRCDQLLREATLKIQEVLSQEDGTLTARPSALQSAPES